MDIPKKVDTEGVKEKPNSIIIYDTKAFIIYDTKAKPASVFVDWGDGLVLG